MSQGLKPCPTCGNQYPEIESGDMVRCNECGESAGFDNWQTRQSDPPYDVSAHPKGYRQPKNKENGNWDRDNYGKGADDGFSGLR